MKLCKICGKYTDDYRVIKHFVEDTVCPRCADEMDCEHPDVHVVRVDPEKEKLVINLAVVVSPDVCQKLQDKIQAQYEKGVVVLPKYCAAAIVSKDEPIEVRGKFDE